VLAQRLARKLCTHCAEEYTPTWSELRALHLDDELAARFQGSTFHRRRGCPRCGQTGYRGRVGVFQLLPMSEHLEQLAAEKASREEIERAAVEEGMRTMWEDGIGKVAAGITSVEELARVCPA
jgi:type II secretory ATPase GspE/PulE/Tfp pilus assembly ATPase PilB-like protein